MTRLAGGRRLAVRAWHRHLLKHDACRHGVGIDGHDQHRRLQGIPCGDQTSHWGAPAVALIAVGSQPDEVKGETARAYVVLKPDSQGTANDILALCREQLAAYKAPRAIQFVADLPRTSTGKIMRHELRKLDN